MAEQPAKIRDVAWSELFPWLMLLRSVRIALMARVLLLGAAGLLATIVGWWAIGEMFSRSTDEVVVEWRHATGLGFWDDSFTSGVPNPWVNTSPRNAEEVFGSVAEPSLVRGPVAIWLYFTRPFILMFDGRLTWIGFLFLISCGIWELLVWGLFGGAITRIAALKFTRDESPGMLAALRHALSKLPSYSLPVLVLLLGTTLFALQLVVIGLLMRLHGSLAFAAALCWPFVILVGLLMAILLLGALFGWPLMWATVSVEGTDAFDALSRSYAYTYQRPWRLLWYVLFAGFLAVASMFVVKLFASSAIALGNWAVHWGVDEDTMHTIVAPQSKKEPQTVPKIQIVPPPVIDATKEAKAPPALEPEAPPPPPTSLEIAAGKVVAFWKGIVAALVAGYQAGFLWVSAVGIYLLLRRDIDGVQMNEVFLDQSEEFGIPPLVDDPTTGIPEVGPGGAIPGNLA